MEEVLAKAELGKQDIDEVLAVGGSTRIPKIRKMLDDFFSHLTIDYKKVDPDNAIALGAAT